MIRAYSNGHPVTIESFKFSGGETQVKVGYASCAETLHLHSHLSSGDDVLELLLVTDAFRRIGIKKINLNLPYLPYARQDRVCSHGESLSLKVFCDLINSQNYQFVNIMDVHSDVALALLNNVTNEKQSEILNRIRGVLPSSILVSPDSGSLKKIYEVSKKFQVSVVRADKTRDPNTGSITGTVVYSEHVGDKNFLIVDDICDGGRTFIELAKVLRPLTTGKVNLYVTHGIFSQGLDVFKGLINKIYCPNVFPNVQDHELLKRI